MRYLLLSGIAALTGSFALPVSANNDLSVDGTSFVLRKDGRTLGSTDLVGAEIDLGERHVLRIDSVRIDPGNPDVVLHRFSVQVDGGQWHNPCGADAEGHREGFPLPGRWDRNGRFHPDDKHFALTCTSGAQAKCVRFGYKPWTQSKDGRSLLPLYEACIRMVRADYCGDGETATRSGTPIDIYDHHGVMQPEPDAAFRFESGWSPEGAVCVNHTRIPDELTLEELARRCPRLADVVGETCTEDQALKRGAVLFNRSR